MTERYPTEPELNFIRKFDLQKNSPKELVEFIESIWAYHDWGFKLTKIRDNIPTSTGMGDKPKYHYHYALELHTAGWSGNESIIEALEKNEWFYFFYWESSRRGGHYKFEIPVETYVKGWKK
jgi:hypothetical protein